jgi:hypothetical protein
MFGLGKKTWIIGGILVALAGTTAYATKMRDRSPEDRAAWATERVAEKLNLNDGQKAAFEKVADEMVAMRGVRTEFMMDLSGKLKELSQDDTLTVEEVNTLRDEIKAEFDKRANAIIPEFVTFYNTLDDEQRDMVTARLENMSERMHDRRHKRGGWGKSEDKSDN